MIPSGQLPALLAQRDQGLRLVTQITQLRAMSPGAELDVTPAASLGDGLNLTMPVSMVTDGLVKQLRALALALQVAGIAFDEADAADLPPIPKKRGRKART